MPVVSVSQDKVGVAGLNLAVYVVEEAFVDCEGLGEEKIRWRCWLCGNAMLGLLAGDGETLVFQGGDVEVCGGEAAIVT